MSLLAPWAAWLSVVGALVVALYLLKIKRRRQVVPAMEIWLGLVGQTEARSLFRRLKRWLSLLLWLIVVACLVLAVGNPVFTFGKIKPRSIVVIIDNSASMQTLERLDDGDPPATRLEQACVTLENLTSQRPVTDEWLLIEAARDPRVLQGWTRDRRAIRDSAESITPFVGSGNIAAACDLAGKLLTGKTRPTITVLSDGAGGRLGKLLAEDERIVFWPIGEVEDNVGIVRLNARPHHQQSAHYVHAGVFNASSDEVEAQLVFEIGGSTRAVEPLSLAGGSLWEKTVVLDAPEGGVLRVSVDREDALPLDNEAHAILTPIRPATVHLVSPREEAFFFEQALVAMAPLVDPEAGRTVSVLDYDNATPALNSPDLTIFNNCVPQRLPEKGTFVFVNEWPADVPVRVIGKLEQPEVRVAAPAHPLTRYVNFGGARLASAKRVDLLDRATVLAYSADEAPLIFMHQSPTRQILTLAFDVLDSDLPFRNAFPMLLRNVVPHLVARQSEWLNSQYQAGDIIRPIRLLPASTTEIAVVRLGQEDAGEQVIAVRDGSFGLANTQAHGPLRFEIGDEMAYTAVNLADNDESNIRPMPAKVEPTEQLQLSGRLLGMVPWFVLALAATALVVLEWLTYNYRWTE